ncbi:MAG: putative PEP-binding protein, partial [bacterium]
MEIKLFGNIEFPSEVDHCVQCGAAGIGLYRTEFLYLDGGCEPTEQQHYDAYCRVAQAFPGRPVV